MGGKFTQVVYRMFGMKYGTNKDLTTRASNENIDPADHERKPPSESFCNLILSTQLQHVDHGTHFCEHR